MAKGFTTMRLDGAKELVDVLLELPVATAKNVVTRALKKAAEPMHRTAVGNARAALGNVRRRRGKFSFGREIPQRLVISTKLSRRQARSEQKVPGDRTVYIGVAPSRVAHLIEFGTGPRYTKAGAYRGQMKAHPYLRPAFDIEWRGALDDLGRILGIEIEKAAARLARKKMKAIPK